MLYYPCLHVLYTYFASFLLKTQTASRLAVSVGLHIAWPQQTRIGFVQCRSVLCAKSYKIKKNRPTTRPWPSSSGSISGCSSCVVGSNVRPDTPAVDGHAFRCAMVPGIPQCRHSSDNCCSVSNDKARVCWLWDVPPIVLVAQWSVDWRLASCAEGVCVCCHAGPTPHSLLQICTYASFQLSHCQPRCCSIKELHSSG